MLSRMIVRQEVAVVLHFMVLLSHSGDGNKNRKREPR